MFYVYIEIIILDYDDIICSNEINTHGNIYPSISYGKILFIDD